MIQLFRTLLLLLLFVPAYAQENLAYQLPPNEILELADYERAPAVQMDTKKEYMLLSYRATYKTLEDLNQDELRLGGLRINPLTTISSTVTYITNLKLRKIKATIEVQVAGLPANPKISNLSWSPDETKIAFSHTVANGVELWLLDVAAAKAVKLTDANVNAALGNPFTWYSDSKRLLVKLLPKNRPQLLDTKKDLPTGPIVSTADGTKSQNRTYQDLLKNKIDEANFETIVTSELYTIDLNGTKTAFKPAAMYAGESFSPDGNYLLLTTIQKPFSYLVPLNRFPMQTVVCDLTGTEIKKVNDVPLTEIMPKGFMAVRKGKRGMSWRNDQPATLYFVTALDEGDPAKQVAFRDEVFTWSAPFTGDPVSLVKTPQRFSYLIWGDNTTAMVTEEWYDTRNTRTFLINPSNPAQAPKVIDDRNSQDIYADPGHFETIKNQYGRQVLALENGNAYLIGEGFTPKGQFPFIDEFNTKTLKTKRLYQSAYTDKKEDIFSIEDFKKGVALVQIQSKSEYPN